MQAVKLFYCYAHEDGALREELAKHLAALKRLGLITEWYDRDIQAGRGWQEEIDKQLHLADIILLLISPDFVNSEYCYSIEMQKSLERHNTQKSHVIPIILRPVVWDRMPFSTLQALPTAGKPITSWQDRDDAFLDVVQGIKKIIEEFFPEKDSQDSASKESALQISQKLEDLATRISASDWYAAAQLRTLSENIRDGRNRSQLTTLNVYQIIDVDKIMERFQNRQPKTNPLLKMIRLQRTAFMFVPLLLILLETSETINAYQLFIEMHPNQMQIFPFLLLWQSGFEGILPDMLRPSSILSAIFVVVMAIVLMTIIISTLERGLEDKKEQRVKKLQEDIIAVLREVEVYLRHYH